MCNVVENVSFEDFKLKNNDSSAKKFEEMSYLLFCSEFNQKKGIFRYKNHPGLETNPIKVEHMKNGVNYQICYGFQAKFYESEKIDSLINKIKDSIKIAIENHPELDKIYLYTNKEISASSEKGKLKPKYQEEVENFAREELKKKQKKLKVENKDIGIGSEVVEWYGPSYFEKILREEKNKYIYDIFFVKHNMTDIIDEAKKHNERILSGIKTEIPFNDKKIEIPRDKIIKEINSYIDTQKHIIISGKSGSGKTAIIKEFYNKNELYSKSLQENEKSIPICVFRADEFDISHENDLSYLKNGLRHGFSFENFLKIYEDEKKKVVIIDSAERILELKKEVFLDIIQELNKNGWIIIFTIQDFCVNDLKDILKERNLLDENCKNIQVKLLELDELKEIKDSYNIKFPENENCIEVLKNLFYLNLYMECYSDDIKNIDLDEFYKLIWKKCIQGKKIGKEFIKLVLERCNENSFYIKDDGVDKNILLDLEKNGIITYYYDNKIDGYFITHDIYEELALKRHISNSYENKRNTLFVEIGNSIRMKREFRLWLSNKIINQFNDDLDEFIKENFQNKELKDEWKDEIIISVLSSNYSKKFFDYFENEIKDNNFKILKHMLKLILRVECDKKCNENGWGEILSFVFKYEDEFFSDKDNWSLLINFELILPVLEKWCSFNREGEITKKSGELILEILKNDKKNCIINSENKLKKISQIIFYTYEEIKKEIKKLGEKKKFNLTEFLESIKNNNKEVQLDVFEKFLGNSSLISTLNMQNNSKKLKQILENHTKIYKETEKPLAELTLFGYSLIENKNCYSIKDKINIMKCEIINIKNEDTCIQIDKFNKLLDKYENKNEFISIIICMLYTRNIDIIEVINKLELWNSNVEIFEKILVGYITYKSIYNKLIAEAKKEIEEIKEIGKNMISFLLEVSYDIHKNRQLYINLSQLDEEALKQIYLLFFDESIVEEFKLEKKVLDKLKKDIFLIILKKNDRSNYNQSDIDKLQENFKLDLGIMYEEFSIEDSKKIENLGKLNEDIISSLSKISFDVKGLKQLDINDIAIIYQLIPYNIQDKTCLKIYKNTLPRIASKLLSYHYHIDNDNYRISSCMKILEKISHFFLGREEKEIDDIFLKSIAKNMTDNEETNQFISSVIVAQDRLGLNKKFWYIWNKLYTKIIEINSEKFDYGKIIENYLLIEYNSQKWENLKIENLDFYDKISKDLKKNPVILLSISKMLNLTEKNEIKKKGIYWIYSIVSKNNGLRLKHQKEETIGYLEKFIKEYKEKNVKKIKEDKSEKDRLIEILDFMIERGSNVASLLKDTIG